MFKRKLSISLEEEKKGGVLLLFSIDIMNQLYIYRCEFQLNVITFLSKKNELFSIDTYKISDGVK